MNQMIGSPCPSNQNLFATLQVLCFLGNQHCVKGPQGTHSHGNLTPSIIKEASMESANNEGCSTGFWTNKDGKLWVLFLFYMWLMSVLEGY